MAISTRKTVAIGSTCLTALAVTYAIYLSLDPERYFYYVAEDRLGWKWDPAYVAEFCVYIIIGALVASAAFLSSRPRQLWIRCYPEVSLTI